MNNMEYWLLDVKRIINVDDNIHAFDYINTYFNVDDAIKEALFLSTLDEVVSVSVHKWTINTKGRHAHSDDSDNVPYHYEKEWNKKIFL